MHIAFFSAHSYDREAFDQENSAGRHRFSFFSTHLDSRTAKLAHDADAVCTFVNDSLDRNTLQALVDLGISRVALRCAGYNQVDVPAADDLGVSVVRVPEYSPYAVAEHTLALILCLNRRIHVAHARVRDGNFRLAGLLGFDMRGRSVGVVGTGRIGSVFCEIMLGLGCRVRACDPNPDPRLLNLGIAYEPLDRLLETSDILSLHCPLTPQTHHLINAERLQSMKAGAMLVNTSRGALVDARALIQSLKTGRIGAVALDVYEEEADLFFEDLSNQVIQDDIFARLTTFPNVLITAHQAFFTQEAMHNIARTTLDNLECLERGEACPNAIHSEHLAT